MKSWSAALLVACITLLGDGVVAAQSKVKLPLGARWTYEVESTHGVRRETLTADIDLANNTYLTSDAGGRLYFERQPHQFIVYDHIGEADSAARCPYQSKTTEAQLRTASHANARSIRFRPSANISVFTPMPMRK